MLVVISNEHAGASSQEDGEDLGPATNYSYSLYVPPAGAARIECATCFGCLYGLETLLQELLPSGRVASGLAVYDRPVYAWRGMISHGW
jgi:hypothetical protein